MARFNVTGMEAVIKDMHRLSQQSGAVADEMLQAGAEVVVEAWKTSIQSHGHIDTGAMLRSVRPTKAATTGDVRSITVYPQGSDKHGVRNATKAYIANFGRTRQRATGFVFDAERAAEGPAQSAMVAIWDRFIGS